MRSRRAFTLVELLVVIAVVVLLVALLLPAALAAREAARRSQCSSNKRQVALAVLGHVSASNRLPSMVDRRFQPLWNQPNAGRKASVSWRFTILPFLEEQSIYEALQDPNAWHLAFDRQRPSEPSTPMAVPVFRCPSDPGPYFLERGEVITSEGRGVLFDALQPADCAAPFRISNFPLPRGDFMLSQHHGAWFGTRSYNRDLRDSDNDYRLNARFEAARLERITDGLSRTVLVAEKAGGTFLYDGNRESPVPKRSAWAWIFTAGGFQIEWTTPTINRNNTDGVFSFHDGAHTVMCDGSGRFLTEDITPSVLGALLIRNDGLTMSEQF